MKKFVIASLSLAALAAPVFAADMPVKATAVPYVSWTGLYAGLNAGYAWGDQPINLTGDPPIIQGAFLTPAGISSVAGDPKGFVGGAQIGYNWQAGRMVYGLEADFDAAHVASSQDIGFFVGIPRTIHGEQNLDWLSTFRARLGYTPVDRLLIYATGGLAVGHASALANLTTPPRWLRHWHLHDGYIDEQCNGGMDCWCRTGIRRSAQLVRQR